MDYKNKKLRHELKYYINYSDYIGLKKKLMPITELDEFSGPEGDYHVRSLYFDDVYNSALYDKNYGVFKRQKFRIRIYNKSDASIKLERKSKYGKYICKESAKLNKEEVSRILCNDVEFMKSYDNEVIRAFYIQFKANVLRPKVIVDYDREAYIMKSLGIRVTFDKQLRTGINSYDIFDKELITLNAFKHPVTIMEVKYDHFLPDNIKAQLQVASSENAAISKYSICRIQRNVKEGEL